MLEFAKHRIVAVFAHPDDEAYSCAGLLAMAAEGGAVVTVVCATRGEAGTDREGIIQTGPTLARLRTVELGLSCRAMGIQPPLFLDCPDSHLDTCDVLNTRIKDVFRRLKPNVVITLGEDGAYGHKDHLAVTDAVIRLVMATPDALRPRLLLVQFPKGLFTQVRKILKKAAPALLDRGDDLFEPAETGINEDDADFVLDIRPWRGKKLNALAAHRSQLKVGDPKSFLIPGLAERLLDSEWYTCPCDQGIATGIEGFTGAPTAADNSWTDRHNPLDGIVAR